MGIFGRKKSDGFVPMPPTRPGSGEATAHAAQDAEEDPGYGPRDYWQDQFPRIPVSGPAAAPYEEPDGGTPDASPMPPRLASLMEGGTLEEVASASRDFTEAFKTMDEDSLYEASSVLSDLVDAADEAWDALDGQDDAIESEVKDALGSIADELEFILDEADGHPRSQAVLSARAELESLRGKVLAAAAAWDVAGTQERLRQAMKGAETVRDSLAAVLDAAGQ